MLPVESALAKLTADLGPKGVEDVALIKANRRVLAQKLIAKRDQPPFAASAMDGYALRYQDIAKGQDTLQFVGSAPAGHGYLQPLNANEIIRIFTGAPLPQGADTILIQENAALSADGSQVIIMKAPEYGAYVRPAGLDYQRGTTLIQAGQLMDYRYMALAASMNYPVIKCFQRARIGVLATGDELVAPGMAPRHDQIVASNQMGIMAYISDQGAIPIDLGIAPDHVEALIGKFREAERQEVDILVTLGGASVGDHDLIQDSMAKSGIGLNFWKVAMRPGKPLMAGRKGPMRLLGLPGNPVSSLVCALLFLRPMIARLQGRGDLRADLHHAYIGEDLPENGPREHYLRCQIKKREGNGREGNGQDGSGREGGGWEVLPFEDQDSSRLALFAAADALMVRAPHAPRLSRGAPVSIMLLGEI